MVRLLKTDLYKMFKMTSFWVIAAISVAMDALNTYISYRMGLVDNTTLGGCLPSTIMGCQLMILIFVAIFSVTDFSSGTIKNIASKGFSRISMYFSKLIVSICAFIFFAIINAITTIIVCQIMNSSGSTNFYSISQKQFQRILMSILSIIVYIALTVLIATLVRRTAGALTITILFASFETIIVQGFAVLVKNVFKSDFDIISYTIYGATAAPDHLLRAAIVLLVYLVVFTAIGIFAFQKRDIN